MKKRNKWMIWVGCIIGVLLLAASLSWVTADADEITVTDPNLKAALQKILGVDTITEAAMEKLEVLDLSNRDISDLTGLDAAVNLQVLSVRNNQISDLTPLRSLTQLQSLDLCGNEIGSLKPLSGLTALRILQLTGNRVGDLSPVAALPRLQFLYCENNALDMTEASENMVLLADMQKRGIFVVTGDPALQDPSKEPVEEPPVSSTPESDASSGVSSNPSSNASSNISSNPSSNVSSNISSNPSSNASSNVSSNPSSNASSNISSNSSSNTSSNISSNTSSNVSSNTSSNVSSDTSAKKLSVKAGAAFVLNETTGYLTGVTVGTTVSELYSQLVYTGNTLKVTKADGIAATADDKIATGMVVQMISASGTVRDAYTVVVYGDINGDGRISITDYLKVKQHLLRINVLQTYGLEAGDLSGDGRVSISDALRIKAYILGKE